MKVEAVACGLGEGGEAASGPEHGGRVDAAVACRNRLITFPNSYRCLLYVNWNLYKVLRISSSEYLPQVQISLWDRIKKNSNLKSYPIF
jgi:hypothetical protein